MPTVTKEQQSVLEAARMMGNMFTAQEREYLERGGSGPVAQEFFCAVRDWLTVDPLPEEDHRALLGVVSKRGQSRNTPKVKKT